MSFDLRDRAIKWNMAHKYPSTVAFLCEVLADKAGKDSKQCWPDAKGLMGRTRLCEETFWQDLNQLWVDGAIDIGKNTNKPGRFANNIYTLIFDEDEAENRMLLDPKNPEHRALFSEHGFPSKRIRVRKIEHGKWCAENGAVIILPNHPAENHSESPEAINLSINQGASGTDRERESRSRAFKKDSAGQKKTGAQGTKQATTNGRCLTASPFPAKAPPLCQVPTADVPMNDLLFAYKVVWPDHDSAEAEKMLRILAEEKPSSQILEIIKFGATTVMHHSITDPKTFKSKYHQLFKARTTYLTVCENKGDGRDSGLGQIDSDFEDMEKQAKRKERDTPLDDSTCPMCEEPWPCLKCFDENGQVRHHDKDASPDEGYLEDQAEADHSGAKNITFED